MPWHNSLKNQFKGEAGQLSKESGRCFNPLLFQTRLGYIILLIIYFKLQELYCKQYLTTMQLWHHTLIIMI